jgi:multiple antibiotic resistance protein
MDFVTELISYVVLVIAALIPIANPFSTAPLFVSMTVGISTPERNHIAFLSTLYMFIVLTVFLLLGAVILSFFGISLPALRIAGGLIVAFIGFRMLFMQDDNNSKETKLNSEDAKKIAFTPLAMPMLSGPGSIAVIMSMAVQISELESLSNQLIGYSVVILGIAISAFICWLVLRASGSVVRFMGESGIDALTKVMGFLLVSIGVQFVITGMRGLGAL